MPKHRRSIIFSCRLYSCLMFLFLLLTQNAHALLTPEPQKVIYGTKSDSVRITSQWEIVFAGNDNGHIDRDALHQILAEDLLPALQQHGITLPILSTPSEKAVKGRIIIGRVGDGTFVDKLFHSSRFRTIELPYSLNDQRYRECYFFESAIDAHGNMSVFIFSFEYQGLAYGIQSLIQLIETDIDIPLVEIIDYPDMKWRGYYIDFRSYKPLGKKRINARLDQEAVDSVLKEVKHYSKYKINRIIFAGPVFDQLDEENLYYLKKIFDACRKRFIEPVPTINSLLWGKSVKNLKQRLAPFIEGVYIQNEPFVIDSNGVARP